MDAVWTFFETNQHQFKTDERGNYELYCVVAAKSVSKFFTAETDYTIDVYKRQSDLLVPGVLCAALPQQGSHAL